MDERELEHALRNEQAKNAGLLTLLRVFATLNWPAESAEIREKLEKILKEAD